ncbi:MAG TPA: hypothetical protein VGK74_15770 [Symbiobacteriaceae bacterium]|jgi:pimeloyl-ACP methyl ester carboxylesterase
MRKLQRLVVLLVFAAVILAWVPARTDAATEPGPPARYPVIFVPGIAGTELYNGSELVWINTWRLVQSQLPIINLFHLNWLMPLRLGADGLTPFQPAYRVQTGDVMRRGLTDAYSGIIASLRDQGYVEGKDLRVFPYDWRQNPTRAADALGRLVDRTLAETGAGQVVLIGHSLGGLVTRDYIVKGGGPKVKALIALATPWLGAPLAYRALEYGWDMGLKVSGTKWSALAPRDLQVLAQNYPAVYSLAPGRGYFDWYPGGYITREGHALTFQESVELGLAPHNRSLAMRAPSYLARLLDGSDHGVMQFVMAGKGRSTSAGYTERRDGLGLMEKTESYVDGDEVVPLYSADLGYSKDPARARTYIGRVISVAYVNQPHTLFTQSTDVQGVVKLWLDVIHGRRAPGP